MTHQLCIQLPHPSHPHSYTYRFVSAVTYILHPPPPPPLSSAPWATQLSFTLSSVTCCTLIVTGADTTAGTDIPLCQAESSNQYTQSCARQPSNCLPSNFSCPGEKTLQRAAHQLKPSRPGSMPHASNLTAGPGAEAQC